MELIEKLGDAASMFWQALDNRERLIVVYAVAGLVTLSWIAGREQRERAREDRIVERIRNGG